MFTGIIETVGRLARFEKRGAAACVFVEAHWKASMDPLKIGESIAVNGCCLTVTQATPPGPPFREGGVEGGFFADLSEETVRLTTFSKARVGGRVNLERALRFSDRLGGHLVSGHVDGMGALLAIKPWPQSTEMRFSIPAPLSKYLVHKGSIAVDGVSLTVALSDRDEREGAFSVHIIPHTGEETTLSKLRVGDKVNLEVDYLAKIVEKLGRDSR